jgi:hypothetical protein
MRPKILAYYFPDYHVDDRNERWFGDSWTEWRLVENAVPRFDDHLQPRIPLLGYQDEADPDVAAHHIDLAASHGIDGFIFDYYWYDDGPYLERALREGFLQAPNSAKVEFSIMWANHDLIDIFGAPPARSHRLLKPGAVDREGFERLARHVIDEYFGHAHYTRIDGRPRFSIYEIGRFVAGLGGVAEAADALRWFDDEARREGHPGVHLDAVMFGFSVLPTEVVVTDPGTLIAQLGVASASSYVWVHHADLRSARGRPLLTWSEVRRAAFEAYEDYAVELSIPFHPNVTVGWDSSPRLAAAIPLEGSGYPGGAVWPPSIEEFRQGLLDARSFAERYPLPYRELTINAWNEWTEGSYLLPDAHHGYRYLEAIRETFGVRTQDGRSTMRSSAAASTAAREYRSGKESPAAHES